MEKYVNGYELIWKQAESSATYQTSISHINRGNVINDLVNGKNVKIKEEIMADERIRWIFKDVRGSVLWSCEIQRMT